MDGMSHMVPGLQGKKMLVTGGSAGIGRATVMALASSGAIVTAAARRKERLDAVLTAAPKGSTVYTVVLDLTSEDSCKAAVKEAVSLMGGLDVVVNCGGAMAGDTNHMTFGHWSTMESLHVSSAWVIAQEALPELKKNGKGSIVNVSSAMSTVPSGSPEMASYSAVKAAQDMVTKSLALQLAKDGVRVNAVSPGGINTEAVGDLAAKFGQSIDVLVSNLAKLHPIGRVGQPDEVAHAIAFLASDLASFITGAVVPVDGGAVLTSSLNNAHTQ
jgi:NAD(P)-dependent dehydrogenase (short-subunit alcohol dehydrogenase family)